MEVRSRAPGNLENTICIRVEINRLAMQTYSFASLFRTVVVTVLGNVSVNCFTNSEVRDFDFVLLY